MLALGSGCALHNFAPVIRRFTIPSLCALLCAASLHAQQPPRAARPVEEDEIPRAAVVAYPAGSAEAARKPVIGDIPKAKPAVAAPVSAKLVPAVAPKSQPVVPPAPVPAVVPDANLQPSWETQKLARNYTFSIPAPRGQITDRNGVPLAQTRISQNLAISFPSPPKFSDAEAARFIEEQVRLAQTYTGRRIVIDAAKAMKHFKERNTMPFVIAQDMKPGELDRLKKANAPGLIAMPLYLRSYPEGSVAAHLIGFVGRQGGFQNGPVENGELLWPEYEGRDGLEKSFNTQLTGKLGVMHVSYDKEGRKSSEKIINPPRPGQNVITTIDLSIQKTVEKSLRAARRPAAMVVIDPHNGEILAMASEPAFDPNIYVPSVQSEVLDKLMKDPFNPLYPRAFRAAYPPGSVFKVVTGLAAMNEGIVDPSDEFGGESVITIDGRKFHNWKKSDVGPLNFVEALTQSCNTYFYKMGLKTGHKPMLDYSMRLGLGSKTGIPINSEEDGNLITTEYMLKHHKQRIMSGDIANMSIGQGATQCTPLQVAQLMSTLASGGTVFQPRLVLQVQDIDDRITFGYDVRVRDQIEIRRDVMKALKAGMTNVVSGHGGTAHAAGVSGFKVGGKTGTAQWGAGKNEKVAAWFAGFAPMDNPQYAFATVYEGKPGDNDVHGGTYAAPIVGRVLKEILKHEPKTEKKSSSRKKRADDEDEDMNREEPPRRRRRAPRDRDEQ